MLKMFDYLYLILLLVTVSCGKISPKGDIAAKDVAVQDFDKVKLSGNFKVFFVGGQKGLVNVETYPNIADNLKIGTSGRTLTISERRTTGNADYFYNLIIYSKSLPKEITAEENAEVSISGGIKTDKLALNLKNNAKFIGSIDTRRTEVTMQGKSRANLRGISQNVFLKIRDTASLIAPFWRVEDLRIVSENGNYAEIDAEDSIKGSVKNTAQLVYYGNPIRALKIDKTANVQNKIPK